MATSQHPELASDELALKRASASLRAAHEDLEYAQDLFVEAANKALRRAVEHQRQTMGLHVPLMRNAMCEHTEASHCGWIISPVRVLGSGPWEQSEFTAFLQSKGVEVTEAVDNVGSLVLGTHDFGEEELRELLAYLDDRAPIYSQELLVCGLVRQKNPYELFEGESMDLVAQSHQALGFILSLGREWPTSPEASGAIYDRGDDALETIAERQSDEASTQFELGAVLATNSPLHMLGYSVEPLGPDDWSRHAILDQAFHTGDLQAMPTGEQQRWGAPGSARRLQAISGFLAFVAGRTGQRSPAGRGKCVADLEWLRERYYDPTMGFEWPRVDGWAAPKRVSSSAFARPVTPDAVLAAIVGPEPIPRAEVVAKLWAYIKEHGLQDELHKKMVNADDKLRPLFGKEQVSMHQLARLISQHVR